jgi:hypothetical protein
MGNLITTGNAIWALVIAFAIHTLVAGRLGHMIPAKVTGEVITRVVSTWTLAGVAGLTVAWIASWLHTVVTSFADWTKHQWHAGDTTQTVIAGAALLATLSVITAIIAGHAISGRFIAEAVVASALLASIPGVAGQYLGDVLRGFAAAGAWLVGLIF